MSTRRASSRTRSNRPSVFNTLRAWSRTSTAPKTDIRHILSPYDDDSQSIVARRRHTSRRPHHRHPIHRLPPEILSHVFLIGTLDDPLFPLRASHVCASWRWLCLRTPLLWSQVVLDHRLGLWNKYMYRGSAACALDIKLSPLTFMDYSTLESQMYTAVHYISRWRSLHIELQSHAPFLLHRALTECCARASYAPTLQELRLIYRQNDDPEEYHLFSGGKAPRLRHVAVDGIRLAWTPSLFQNLTTLEYTHHGFTSGPPAVREIMNSLSISVNLTSLRLLFPSKKTNSLTTIPQHGSSRTRRQQSYVTTRKLTLPYLQSLHIVSETRDIPYELSHVSSLIITPSLTALHFVDLGFRARKFASLNSFMQLYQFPVTLEVMTVAHGWYNGGGLKDILRRLPKMQRLAIRRDGCKDHFYHF